ncbi:hypothetical protein G5B40_00850 [Pikeienuella piscinae]|uniref:Uncharacterized protein n=1 Tax=Pikeienuella piscinae TaxID=2748098 RepID=A0A7L5BU26_9RHOB|nr:DUF6428 family protein [Pikeienuella piscinae]QIE54118.1 hypothetical protein G5B40_00850 [Pikeienuella piscinae]
MTFATLLSGLERLDAAAALIFEFDGQPVGAGYHVTELRHSTSTGIDCGGKVETWQEARLQLLDGPGEAHMSVGKFRGILEKSLGRLPELSDAPLLVEFSPGNSGLRLMVPGEPSMKNGLATVYLRDSRAICKPAERKRSIEGTANGCCGASNPASACCGSERAAGAREACCM